MGGGAELCQHLNLELPHSKTENIHFSGLSSPVRGTLLWQPKLTNAETNTCEGEEKVNCNVSPTKPKLTWQGTLKQEQFTRTTSTKKPCLHTLPRSVTR